MLGALIGDIAGSRFEWNNIKSKEFELLTYRCHPTDDSIMSLAVAQALMSEGNLRDNTVTSMQTLGRKYPNAGYGGKFRKWIASNNLSLTTASGMELLCESALVALQQAALKKR